HDHPAKYSSGCAAWSNRTHRSMEFGSMTHGTTSSVIPLDSALKSFSNGATAHVNEHSFFENLIDRQFVANVIRRRIGHTELLKRSKRRQIRLLEGAERRLIQFAFLYLEATYLDGIVTVRLLGDFHCDDILAELDDSHGHDQPFFI